MRYWVKYLIVTMIVAILTNSGQFYLWNDFLGETKQRYEEQINVINEEIEAIGYLEDIYTVTHKTRPGEEVSEYDLQVIQVPVSTIKESYILDHREAIGKYYKISIMPGTPLTHDLLMEDEITDNIREVDLIANTWAIGLKEGDYVDCEITYPYGEKYVVLSHVRVDEINEETIKTNLTHIDRHTYNGALVDYFLQKENGATIDFIKYPEPGIQKPAEVTYSVPTNILSIMVEDPNILAKINKELQLEKRNKIDQYLNLIGEDEESSMLGVRSELESKINSGHSEYGNEQQKIAEEQEKAEKEGLQVGKGVVE